MKGAVGDGRPVLLPVPGPELKMHRHGDSLESIDA